MQTYNLLRGICLGGGVILITFRTTLRFNQEIQDGGIEMTIVWKS